MDNRDVWVLEYFFVNSEIVLYNPHMYFFLFPSPPSISLRLFSPTFSTILFSADGPYLCLQELSVPRTVYHFYDCMAQLSLMNHHQLVLNSLRNYGTSTRNMVSVYLSDHKYASFIRVLSWSKNTNKQPIIICFVCTCPCVDSQRIEENQERWQEMVFNSSKYLCVWGSDGDNGSTYVLYTVYLLYPQIS